MKSIEKKIITVLLMISIILSSSGCGKVVQEKIRNAGILTEDEYRRIRSDELKFSVSRKRNVNTKTIEWYDVKEDISNLLINKTMDIINEHNINLGYINAVKNTHEYLKLNIDNLKCLRNPQFIVTTNEGYYYVRTLFGVEHSDEVAELKKTANYLGIKGAIGKDYLGNVIVDEIYLNQLVKEVNKVRVEQGLDELPEDIEQFNYNKDLDNEFEELEPIVATESEISTMSNIIKQIEKKDEEEQQGRQIRRLVYNSKEFNDVMVLAEAVPYIPETQVVFNVPEYETLSGYQIYKEGEDIEGTRGEIGALELVFVYKHNLETNEYDYHTVYISQYETGIEKEEIATFVPEYIKKQVDILIERISRSWSNCDITGLTCGDLIYPQDLGIKLLLQRDATTLLNSDMYVKKYLERNGNRYLVELEQMSTEMAKGTATTGCTYLRTYLAEIEIRNAKCVLMDMYLTKIKLLSMPEVNIDKGSMKKLFAIQMVMQDTLTDEVKEEVKAELRKLQIALTIRNMNDNVQEDGITINKGDNGIERYGINTRFNTDRTILGEKEFAEYIAELTSRVTRYGGDIPCRVSIRVREWISGNDEQVELLTDELYDYNKKSATKLNRYMILSKFKNKWQIDEMKIVGENEVPASELEAVINEYEID